MIGIEARKRHQERHESGFYAKYMSGTGIDVGFRGPGGDEPILPNAVGIELGSPKYDGIHLPVLDESQDFIFSSHSLEHIPDYVNALKDWHRAIKIGGHIVLLVPHGFLYERSFYVPGPWGSCDDHKRVYTPSRLLREIEESLRPNTYRVRSLRDVDHDFDYSCLLKNPPAFYKACFEIECVIQKIAPPGWEIS